MEYRESFMFSSFSSENWASESFQRFESFCSQMNASMTSSKFMDMKPFDLFPQMDMMRPFSESFSDNLMPYSLMPLDLFCSSRPR
jgi:hypothetical protein